jgi:hypothetical protein
MVQYKTQQTYKKNIKTYLSKYCDININIILKSITVKNNKNGNNIITLLYRHRLISNNKIGNNIMVFWITKIMRCIMFNPLLILNWYGIVNITKK